MLDDPNTRNWVLGALQSRRKCLEPSGCPGQVEETWSVGRFLAAGPSVVWLWVRWGHERPQQLMWTLTPKTNLLESLNLLNPMGCIYTFYVAMLLYFQRFRFVGPGIGWTGHFTGNPIWHDIFRIFPLNKSLTSIPWGYHSCILTLEDLSTFESSPRTATILISLCGLLASSEEAQSMVFTGRSWSHGSMGPLDSVEEKRSIVALAISKSMEKGVWIALFWNPIVLFYLSWFANIL